MSYSTVSYTQKELDYFHGLTKDYEKKEGRTLNMSELIDKAINDRNDDLIQFLRYMQIMMRSKRIMNKLKHTNFNFREGKDKPPNYTQRQIYEFNKTIDEYCDKYCNGKNIPFMEAIDRAIENEDWGLINYLDFTETDRDGDEIAVKIANKKIDDAKAKDKRVKKFIKRFFKDFPQFKEVPERKGCHSMLMFSEDDLKNYHIFINDDSNKDITEAIESGLFRIVYLKNTNPRDSKRVSHGIIKHSLPSRSYTQ